MDHIDIPQADVDNIDENVVIPQTPVPVKKFDLTPSPQNTMFQVGETVIAKWSEDNVWYNATVEALADDNITVLFTDYGNTDVVTASNIVMTRDKIPAGEEVDVNVPDIKVKGQATSNKSSYVTNNDISSQLKVNDEVIARWSDDNVWYNAKILSINTKDNKATVVFTDYGNESEETLDRIVTDRSKPASVEKESEYSTDVLEVKKRSQALLESLRKAIICCYICGESVTGAIVAAGTSCSHQEKAHFHCMKTWFKV